MTTIPPFLTFSINFSSTKGPFFKLLAIINIYDLYVRELFAAALHDHLARPLIPVPSLDPHRRLAPRRLGMTQTDTRAAFTSTMRMITRVHRGSTHPGPPAFPDIYQQNIKVLFQDFLKAYKDKEGKYNLEPLPQSPVVPATSVGPGQPVGMKTGQATASPIANPALTGPRKVGGG